MNVTTLTPAERLILANQYRILAATGGHNTEDYASNIEILEKGYAGFYGWVFAGVEDEVPAKVTTEVHRIFTMFSRIRRSITALKTEERDTLDKRNLEFDGFDENHDDHYAQVKFMRRNGDYTDWENAGAASGNSSSLVRYIRQLAVFDGIISTGEARTLTLEELQEIAQA